MWLFLNIFEQLNKALLCINLTPLLLYSFLYLTQPANRNLHAYTLTRLAHYEFLTHEVQFKLILAFVKLREYGVLILLGFRLN